MYDVGRKPMLVNQLVFGYFPITQRIEKRLIAYHGFTPIIGYHNKLIDYAQFIEYNVNILDAGGICRMIVVERG